MAADIASYIDHTQLSALTSYGDIDRICEEARTYGFAAVCIPPFTVRHARTLLSGDMSRLATVIGFPLGYSVPESKWTETEYACRDGADELDVVINLMALRSGDWSLLEKEMVPICQTVHAAGRRLKVIIESGMLTEEEIIRCCSLYAGMGADYIKTSTGFAAAGASVEAVRLMKEVLPPTVGIKASGGIRTLEMAWKLVDAGASRLGTSAGVRLAQEEREKAGA
jgi:deoxyribose-phosphate aldolase